MIDVIYAVIAILLFVGLINLFDANPFKDEKRISLSFTKSYAKSKRDQINADRELNKREELVSKINGLLMLLDKDWQYYYKLMFICFVGGFIFGVVVVADFLLAIPMGIISIPLSYLILRSKAGSEIRRQLDNLENAMSIITNGYMVSENIITAVESYVKAKNRGLEEDLIKITPFDKFIANTRMINPNIKRALKILAAEIDNEDFTAWANVLILCQDDKGLKYMLKPIVQGMNDVKALQLKSDTEIANAWKNYIMMVILTFLTIPFLRMMEEEWFLILTDTTVGRILILLMIISALGSSIYAAKVNKPIRGMK